MAYSCGLRVLIMTIMILVVTFQLVISDQWDPVKHVEGMLTFLKRLHF